MGKFSLELEERDDLSLKFDILFNFLLLLHYTVCLCVGLDLRYVVEKKNKFLSIDAQSLLLLQYFLL